MQNCVISFANVVEYLLIVQRLGFLAVRSVAVDSDRLFEGATKAIVTEMYCLPAIIWKIMLYSQEV